LGVGAAAVGLDRAREGLSRARAELLDSNDALRIAKERAVHDSLHDSLTGLPNRSFVLHRLQSAIDAGSQDFAVFFIDLDRFKIVNDSLGHVAGDNLLVQVAQRLAGVLCPGGLGEGVSEEVLARLGGDEFVVVANGLATEVAATAVADRLLGALAPPFLIEGEVVHCAASIGVTLGRIGYREPDDILRDADLAMFKAKGRGKSRAEIYRPSMHALAKTRLHLENDMRRALIANEFVLHYQPIVDLASGALIEFEALVRWQHPMRGLTPPADFIAVAEETGFIVEIGEWVAGEACRKAVAWGAKFGRGRAPGVSVNLSPRQFAQPDLIERVTAILVKSGVDPRKVVFEITESSTIGDSERAVHVLGALKALGLKLSVDDFGTGYSSLSYLHRLPIDMLKIDRSFVSEMMHNRESRQIIRTILRLADSLGMRVVAEGIETVEQMAELRGFGCQFGQGYFFSRPLREADADAYVAQALQTGCIAADERAA
jgi:diguanylate cyclase (GGDEF)-like protein